MEPVNRGKRGQLNPAFELVARRRAIEAADVESPVIEAGQGEAGTQPDLLMHIVPPTADVARPRGNIAVAACETRAGQQEWALPILGHLIINGFVVLDGIGIVELFNVAPRLSFFIPAHPIRTHTRRFVHVEPEAFHALIQDHVMLLAPPFLGLWIEEVCQAGSSAPRPDNILLIPGPAVHKVAVLHTIWVILRLCICDIRVVYHTHTYIEAVEFCNHPLWVGEISGIPLRRATLILIPLNIRHHHIQRDFLVSVCLCHTLDILLGVTIMALDVSITPFGREVCFPDDIREGLCNLLHGRTVHEIVQQLPAWGRIQGPEGIRFWVGFPKIEHRAARVVKIDRVPFGANKMRIGHIPTAFPALLDIGIALVPGAVVAPHD